MSSISPLPCPAIISDKAIQGYNHTLLETTFSTLTNVNFDHDQSKEYIKNLTSMKDDLKSRALKLKIDVKDVPLIDFKFTEDFGVLQAEGRKYGVFARFDKEDSPDNFALRELLRYGLKGVSAYFTHAERVRSKCDTPPPGYSDKERAEIYAGLNRAWVKMEEPGQKLEDLFKIIV